MKKNQIALILLICIVGINIANAQSKLSANAYKLSKLLKNNSKNSNDLMNDEYLISMICKLDDNFDYEKAKRLGAKFSTTVNNIATIRIASNKYLEFIELPGILYIESGASASPKLDSAKATARIQAVIEGVDLEQKYNGEGVVVGIIDAGFDYTHPAFVDPDNGELIIKRVWEQGKTGNKPDGFSYGRELTTTEQILDAKCDIENFSHGTHVAGIAVGQRLESAEQSIGIAKKSELVIVALTPPSQEQWKSTTASDIVDAVNYIFKYAESAGKAAVVNLSWGGQIGPHDGTSLFSQAIDGLTGEGKIFVLSAGNDGAVKLHIEKELNKESPMVTYVRNQFDASSPKNGIWIDAWGEKGKPFEFNFEIVNQNSLKPLYQTNFHSTDKDTVINFKYSDSNGECEIHLFLDNCPYNEKPHAFVDVECSNRFLFRISAKADEGKLHMWNWYLVDYYGIEKAFESIGSGNSIAGNTTCTVSDYSCTNSAISVGASISKNSYLNYTGNMTSPGGKIGALADFSSHGPSADNRVKPDIVAPGMYISSAVSSFDKEFGENGYNRLNVTSRVEHNGKTFSFAALRGTSMSSPVMAGAVALLLSKNKKLTPQEILELIKLNSKEDDQTKELPNALWGWGKLDLYKMFKQSKVESTFANDKITFYPNPVGGDKAIIELKLDIASYIEILLCDNLGNEVLNIYSGFENKGMFTNTFDTKALASGIYFLKIKINDKITYKKIIN